MSKLRTVGWGPFRLPGEKRWEVAARAEADLLIRLSDPDATPTSASDLAPAAGHVKSSPDGLIVPVPESGIERGLEDGDDAGPSLAAGIEQLNARELKVLRYLATPLDNTAIAEELGISLNTLKTHLRHIYSKLGVTGRRDAAVEIEQFLLLRDAAEKEPRPRTKASGSPPSPADEP
jgi:DNA-binding CsgD family transcriptional regulator